MVKRVLFDTNFFSWFCDNASSVDFVPDDASDSLVERFDLMLSDLEDQAAEIVIPAPVLAEVLCASRINPQSVLTIINQQVIFRIVSFGQRAAEEFGQLFRASHRGSENRNAFKFDLQILAIAKVELVDVIYSSDQGLLNKAAQIGITSYSFQTLPRPPRPAQGVMQFPAPPTTIQ